MESNLITVREKVKELGLTPTPLHLIKFLSRIRNNFMESDFIKVMEKVKAKIDIELLHELTTMVSEMNNETYLKALRRGLAEGFVQCLRGDEEAAQKAVTQYEDPIKEVETWKEDNNRELLLNALKEDLALLRAWIDANATEFNEVLNANKE